MLQTILGIFRQLWFSIVSFLPGSPLKAFISGMDEIPYLAEFNWFFPASECIAVLEVWLIAVSLYYIYSAIMRFVRVIG